MDVVGGFHLADGTAAKALTGIDDHSRFCVSARLMPRERTQAVCDGLAAAMRAHGVPEQILTDNGKVFTGRFHAPPVEVLFDRICRENGVEHLLTAPRSPTTTGKVERFHRTLRLEFDTTRVFASLALAQGALDEWVEYYNTDRPHQSLSDATPADRFHGQRAPRPGRSPRAPSARPGQGRSGSRARSPPTGWPASAPSRSASGRTSPAATATSWSPGRRCSSGSATSS